MKYLLLCSFFFLSVTTFAQSKLYGYIELRGSVDLLGNISLDPLDAVQKETTPTDTLIDYGKINAIINRHRAPIKVLNALSELGWELITTTQVASDKDQRPNAPFLLYYLKKEYLISRSKN